jgi:sec-independent protein translocase protein TatB
MFGIGLTELVLIVIVALIFISPEKLPEVARAAAKTLRDARKTGNELKRAISDVDIPKVDAIKSEILSVVDLKVVDVKATALKPANSPAIDGKNSTASSFSGDDKKSS